MVDILPFLPTQFDEAGLRDVVQTHREYYLCPSQVQPSAVDGPLYSAQLRGEFSVVITNIGQIYPASATNAREAEGHTQGQEITNHVDNTNVHRRIHDITKIRQCSILHRSHPTSSIHLGLHSITIPSARRPSMSHISLKSSNILERVFLYTQNIEKHKLKFIKHLYTHITHTFDSCASTHSKKSADYIHKMSRGGMCQTSGECSLR